MQPGDFQAVGGSSSVVAPWPQETTTTITSSPPRGAEPAPRLPATSQSRMENFRKVKTSEEESPLPFPDLPADVVEMKVKEGSKIRNLMGFAMGRMGQEDTRSIVFSGCGRAVTKTVTCVEIMKRKLGGLHQVTKVQYRTVREVWESRELGAEGATEHLTVHKNVPSICILLSKDPLDPTQMGYQPPELPGGLWGEEGDSQEEGSGSSPKGVKRKLASPRHEAGGAQNAKRPPVQGQDLPEDSGTMAGC